MFRGRFSASMPAPKGLRMAFGRFPGIKSEIFHEPAEPEEPGDRFFAGDVR